MCIRDSGISMLGVPEEFGGIPADYVTQMLALMEVSKCGAPAFLITNGQCIHSMRRFGSAEQLRKTAESTLETGDPAYALALTEPGAGSDNNSATTTYTRKNGKVYINGQKTFITGAKEYPYMLVLARDPQPKDPKKAFTPVSYTHLDYLALLDWRYHLGNGIVSLERCGWHAR